jgi:hypothetical protein
MCPECLSDDIEVREFDFGIVRRPATTMPACDFGAGPAVRRAMQPTWCGMRRNHGSFLGGAAAGGLVARFRQRHAR